MKNIKEKIFDLVYDELENEAEKNEILEFIDKDTELKKYYEELLSDSELICEDDFISSDENFLKENRNRLFDTINDSVSSSEKESTVKNIFNFGKAGHLNSLLKYAAVILLTFYATMYHFGGPSGSENTGRLNISNEYETTPNITPVNYIDSSPFAETDRQLQNYRVDNLSIDENGDDLQIDFDISTSKTIKGKKSDPVIINTLKYLIAHESNPGVKLRTLKAMDKSGTNKYEESLINTMLNDQDELIRRKAMKMISKTSMSKKAIDALYNVVLNDPDQINRIEALNILEEHDETYADKALTNMPNEDDEYLKYKTTLINK